MNKEFQKWLSENRLTIEGTLLVSPWKIMNWKAGRTTMSLPIAKWCSKHSGIPVEKLGIEIKEYDYLPLKYSDKTKRKVSDIRRYYFKLKHKGIQPKNKVIKMVAAQFGLTHHSSWWLCGQL